MRGRRSRLEATFGVHLWMRNAGIERSHEVAV